MSLAALRGRARQIIVVSGAWPSDRAQSGPRFAPADSSFALRLKAVRERETHLHLAKQFRVYAADVSHTQSDSRFEGQQNLRRAYL